MKKTLTILACAAAVMSMGAQQQVVKDAEKAMKSGKDFTVVAEMIAPAQSNPETAKDAAVYYIPGKAGFNQYDNMLGKRQLGMLKEGEEAVMAAALMAGYNNFVKALPLDTVVDAKGKVKTKYSKDIHNVISGHYNDFTQAGIDFYNNKDFKNAYDAWETFTYISENPAKFGMKPESVQPDSVVANFVMNAGLAAWQDGDNAKAARTFEKAAKKGYDKENVWQYGLATAIQSDQPEILYYFATEGNERFGDKDSQYINSLINFYLKAERYDEAIKYLENAIAQRPNASQYYALEGIIYESKENEEKAMELYKKAVTLDPNNGLANYYYGRGLSLEAGRLADAFEGTEAQFQKYYKTELLPRYEEAIKILEAAYDQDESNRSNTLNLLEQLYYVTNNEAGMDSVKERKLAD